MVNGGTWLARILPALTSGGQPAYLRDTWMTTNIVFLQDLALWLPLNAVAAAWLWARTPRGYLPGGASVVMGEIESISIAVTFSSLAASFSSLAASHCCRSPSSYQTARQRPCSSRAG